MLLVKDKKTIDATVGVSKELVQAREVTVTGTLTLKIPGTEEPYHGDRVEISYNTPMDVAIEGSQIRTGDKIDLRKGTLTATGYRRDAAKEALQRPGAVVDIVKDPYVVLFRGDKEVVRMPQVQGVPRVDVVDGRVSYKK